MRALFGGLVLVFTDDLVHPLANALIKYLFVHVQGTIGFDKLDFKIVFIFFLYSYFELVLHNIVT